MTGTPYDRIPREVPEWHKRGACNLFPELADAWHDAKPHSPAALACRTICAACPVRELCARDALERGEPWGIWGGLDRHDRKQVARDYGYPAPAVLPEHGTNARYAKHECRCPECRAAHTRYESERRWRHRVRDWRPVELDHTVRVGRRWVGAGQLMLPIDTPEPPQQATRTTRGHLALVA